MQAQCSVLKKWCFRSKRCRLMIYRFKWHLNFLQMITYNKKKLLTEDYLPHFITPFRRLQLLDPQAQRATQESLLGKSEFLFTQKDSNPTPLKITFQVLIELKQTQCCLCKTADRCKVSNASKEKILFSFHCSYLKIQDSRCELLCIKFVPYAAFILEIGEQQMKLSTWQNYQVLRLAAGKRGKNIPTTTGRKVWCEYLCDHTMQTREYPPVLFT